MSVCINSLPCSYHDKSNTILFLLVDIFYFLTCLIQHFPLNQHTRLFTGQVTGRIMCVCDNFTQLLSIIRKYQINKLFRIY